MSQSTLTERPYSNSNLFSGHYLDERLQDREEWDCDAAARAVMEDLQTLYEHEQGLVEGYNEDPLIQNWIDETLDILGFGTQVEVTLPDGSGYTDDLLFVDESTRREAAEMYLDTDDTRDLYERAVSIVEAKQWDADFAARFSEERPYRNASHQIKHYLERTPENIQWGVLTNGRKWRLYGTKDYETETYYEVDLPELLASGSLREFKYFYLFFRPAAFRESAGTTFLDTVWSESEAAARELGEDLQDNVFTALRVLGIGFVETNDLDVEPDDEAQLDELKNQSLVLLYRLMFVLYAEARGLIHPDDPAAEEEYDEYFSLERLRTGIHDTIGEVDTGFDDEYSEHSTAMWNRLENLFGLIRDGEESLGIPPYDGGLFEEDGHGFLTENEVSDRYVAEVVYRLSTTENGDGRYVLADYADLDTRHLGSVYEGLLEHQFRIAPEQYAAVSEDGGQVWKSASEADVDEAIEVVRESGLYVVNDEGKRKVTGAYYTPDYIVTYIVERTVGPLVDEIEESLESRGLDPENEEYVFELSDRVLDLNILDPAMGSGHFLTKTTGYLAERVMERVRDVASELGTVYDEQAFRRDVAKECIYGVDVNGMAVELAKLSMWLETLAADQPLAFLDHHFKEGNSLIGSDVEEIVEGDQVEGPGQVPLDYDFERTREEAMARLTDDYEELFAIPNETREDVNEMKEIYRRIEEDERRRRFVSMANVHAAERFDVEVPAGAFRRMAEALEDGEDWADIESTEWFTAAQSMAEGYDFFHWKLEFLEVFHGDDGELLEDGGFDAVIGNPPWVGIRTGNIESPVVEYLKSVAVYDSATGQFDLAAVFLDVAVHLLAQGRTVGFVVPKRLATNEGYERLRRKTAVDRHLISAIDLGVAFDGVNNDALILLSGDTGDAKTIFGERRRGHQFDLWETEPSLIRSMPFHIFPTNNTEEEVRIVDKAIQTSAIRLGERITIERGAECGMNHESITTNETEGSLPILDHLDVGPYAIHHSGHYIDTTAIEPSKLKSIDIYETTPKLLVRFLSPELIIARDTFGYVSTNLVYHVQCDDNVDFLCGLVSSKLLNFWYFVGFQNDEVKFPHVQQSHINSLPVPDFDDESDEVHLELSDVASDVSTSEVGLEISPGTTAYEAISEAADSLVDLYDSRNEVNLTLLDYVTNVPDGPPLTDIGFYQPPQTDSTDSELYQTAGEDGLAKLKIDTVSVKRPDENTAVIEASARYKPDDEDDLETDQYGYFETDPIEAFRLTDLSELEADLVEAFVPAATEEAGGFANFRQNATKTISLVDRLKALTLPDPDAVEDDLRNYLDAKARADELDEKIERTEKLIDEIVYELYGLTDEEIEIVEEAVADD